MTPTIRLLVLTMLPFNAPGAQTVAFENVSVIPMTSETVLENQTVVVSDGRIRTIAPANGVTLEENTLRIDGNGLYLVPGLSEMHAHVPPMSSEAALDRVLFLNVANGVTTIRGMLGGPDQLVLREQLANGTRLGPRLYTSGPSFNGNSVSNPDDARRMIREQQEAGYDFAKLHPGLTLEEFVALDETADEIGFTYAGHVSTDVSLVPALAAGQASIDHLDGYIQALVPPDIDYPESDNGFFGIALAPLADDARIALVAEATADAGVWVVPTQTLIEHWSLPEPASEMAKRPEMRYMPQATVNQWIRSKNSLLESPDYDPAIAEQYSAIRRRLILALSEAGAGLLLGSDAPQVFNVPGFATRQELELLVSAGLTPYQALQAGTVNPAIFFGAEAEFGTLQAGLAADMLLVEGNPLDDIRNMRNIRGVVVRGQWLPADEIKAGLDELAAR